MYGLVRLLLLKGYHFRSRRAGQVYELGIGLWAVGCVVWAAAGWGPGQLIFGIGSLVVLSAAGADIFIRVRARRLG